MGKKALMTAMKGKGREIQELLRRELGIPDTCQWFTVKFSLNDVVRVECEFIAEETGKRNPDGQ